jgi:predicted adenylyl cyclase CyaB
MKRNIEIKCRIHENLEMFVTRVTALADQGPIELRQDDVFFLCPKNDGRLKLRTFSATVGELIFYQRPDKSEPKESKYSIVRTSTPDSLRDLLSLALGVTGRVRKVRKLFFVGRTRIHIDQIFGLSDSFIELEIVLAEDECVEAGVAEAYGLLERLGLSSNQLIAEAYVDLLASSFSQDFVEERWTTHE